MKIRSSHACSERSSSASIEMNSFEGEAEGFGINSIEGLTKAAQALLAHSKKTCKILCARGAYGVPNFFFHSKLHPERSRRVHPEPFETHQDKLLERYL